MLYKIVFLVRLPLKKLMFSQMTKIKFKRFLLILNVLIWNNLQLVEDIIYFIDQVINVDSEQSLNRPRSSNHRRAFCGFNEFPFTLRLS